MYIQGTMIGSKFVSSSLAIGLMIAGKIVLLPGLVMIIVGSTTYYDTCAVIYISIGSVALVAGLILLIAGAVIYYRIRKNPVRSPHLPVMTVGPVGSYPATLYPSSTAYVVPPGYMPQGMQSTQGMQETQGIQEPQGMQVPPPYTPVPPPYAQGPSANPQASYGFTQKS